MTIYSDAIGNRFLGDCIWANHNINYPTTKYLKAHPYSDISTELTALCTQAGLQFRDIASQSLFNTPNTLGSPVFICFGANSDTIDDRYAFGMRGFNDSGDPGLPNHAVLYNNSGATYTNNNANSTNRLMGIHGVVVTGSSPNADIFGPVGTTVLNDSLLIECNGVSDGESLSLLFTITNADRTFNRNVFYYAGLLADVNTNFNYYSENIITKSVLFASTGAGNLMHGGHRIGSSNKEFLKTGDAQYPIVCADAQTPTSQWATDMYVFDNNSTLGFPAIGRVRNLLLATGSYTIGKPVKIQGSAMPDAGFNRWIPVREFAGKTVLMRCYSSVDI